MPETLTDAQKVIRNSTGLAGVANLERIANGVEALASEVTPAGVIAPEYDAEQTYAVGDMVIFRSVLYRCTTAITTPEEWTAVHWTATMVSDAYRQAVDQDAIDANLMALGLSGASVGDLVRVAAVDTNGKPTSWKHVPLCEIVTNENMLDNWDFVGGGSQQTDIPEAFPINQRGLTSYQNAGNYTIDRWKLVTGGALSIDTTNKTHIKFTANGATYSRFMNFLGHPLEPGTYTLSFLLKVNSSSGDVNMRLNDNGSVVTGGNKVVPAGNDKQLVVNTITVLSTINKPSVELLCGSSVTADVDLYAAKLELGSEQTLAHQENGAWVLNELPNYETELIKCKTSTADPTDTYANNLVQFGKVEMGKTLWTGDFIGDGSISVPGLSKYSLIMINATTFGYSLIGSKTRGGTLFGSYNATAIETAAYRFSSNGDILIVNSNDRGIYLGGSTTHDGGSNCHITKIVGLIPSN